MNTNTVNNYMDTYRKHLENAKNSVKSTKENKVVSSVLGNFSNIKKMIEEKITPAKENAIVIKDGKIGYVPVNSIDMKELVEIANFEEEEAELLLLEEQELEFKEILKEMIEFNFDKKMIKSAERDLNKFITQKVKKTNELKLKRLEVEEKLIQQNRDMILSLISREKEIQSEIKTLRKHKKWYFSINAKKSNWI